jgi:hypothetical protein
MRAKHSTLLIGNGLIWLAAGLMLMPKGVMLLVNAAKAGITAGAPLLTFFASFIGGYEEAAVVLLAASLYLGFLKARHIFSKTVHRLAINIQSLPNPANIRLVFGKGYLLLIGFMMLLGMSLRYVGVPDDIRGFIDVAIGAALINGSFLFFRKVQAIKNPT